MLANSMSIHMNIHLFFFSFVISAHKQAIHFFLLRGKCTLSCHLKKPVFRFDVKPLKPLLVLHFSWRNTIV